MTRFTFILACLFAVGNVHAQQPTQADLRDDGELLRRDDVRKELEVIDEQVDGLERSSQAVIPKVKELLKIRQTMSVEEYAKRTADMLQEQRLAQLAARDEFLLPHQLRRLAEIRWQYRAINGGVAAYHQAFSLTRDQSKQMQADEARMHDELLGILRRYKERSDRELLEILTPSQRVEWEKRTGARFDFRSKSPGLSAFMRLR